MEKDIQAYIARDTIRVLDAMKQIDKNGKGILYIVDELEKLIGSLTDGDIRRWIIRTGDIDATVGAVVFRDTKCLNVEKRKHALTFMEEHAISSVPILYDNMKIADIIFDEKMRMVSATKEVLADVPIIIMAGGKGTRLYPYTKILPKPLIPIGDIPILERIIDKFLRYGANRFYITVNYRKEMIKAYFAENHRDYQITFVEEDMPLGTAGSIRLIEEKFDQPVIVTNCDILIEADYGKILEHHCDAGNDMTIVSSLKNMSIPYGVLHTKEEGIITDMEEKPQLSYFINTGMYVVEPELFTWIPENKMFHMTELAELVMKRGGKLGMYPISENSFLDMGEFEEMKKMEARINAGEVS